jgi:hypothetical protein
VYPRWSTIRRDSQLKSRGESDNYDTALDGSARSLESLDRSFQHRLFVLSEPFLRGLRKDIPKRTFLFRNEFDHPRDHIVRMASAIACTACLVAEYAPTMGGLTTPRTDDRKTTLRPGLRRSDHVLASLGEPDSGAFYYTMVLGRGW